MSKATRDQVDILLIGAGIMSATLGALLQQLDPSLRIGISERLEQAAAESSDAWNNAGTGHSAFCELNYTPRRPDGSVDIHKAIQIAESFEVSKQFWAYLVDKRIIRPSTPFIHSIPHMSFVWGEDNCDFLRERFDALQTSPLFTGMQFSSDFKEITEWIPLVMQGRSVGDPVAATRMDLGTDVNFGSLTRCLFDSLQSNPQVSLSFNQEVRDIEPLANGWKVKLQEMHSGERKTVTARFVFIGAGGGSLPLLLKSGIPEAQGYGGFPISGQWLRCTNEDVIARHDAKVYGLAAVGSPPMSVPHLDTRWIRGKKELLFGPYAGFTTRFLKHGSVMDLFKSVKLSNLRPMLAAGMHNLPLTRYLIEQVRLSPEDRLDALRAYYPNAKKDDWELAIAGYRVQVIKKDEEDGGVLEFGTEVVTDSNGSIAALLGASPGASTAVSIMLDLLKKCFPDQMAQSDWKQKLQQMIPSYEQKLNDNPGLLQTVRNYTHSVLGLTEYEYSHNH